MDVLEIGTSTTVYLVISEEEVNVSDKFFGKMKEEKVDDRFYSKENEKFVWDYCMKIVSPYLDKK